MADLLDRRDRPNVLAPPPVLTAICAALAWLAQHVQPVPLLPGGLASSLGVRVAGSLQARGALPRAEVRRDVRRLPPASEAVALRVVPDAVRVAVGR